MSGIKPASVHRWALPAAAAIAFVDLITKEMIQKALTLGESVSVTGFFNLVYVMNPGAAFSFLAGAGGWQRPLLLAIGISISAVLVYVLVRRPVPPIEAAGLASVLGGAVGNVIDRARHGAVVDWLDFHVSDWHWPAFNVADIGITLGVAALLADAMFGTYRARRSRPAEGRDPAA